MATYFTDFSDGTVGQRPTGWSLSAISNAADDWLVQSNGGTKMLQAPTGSTARNKVVLFDTPGDIEDVEVLVKVIGVGMVPKLWPMTRARFPNSFSSYGYLGGVESTTTARVREWNGNSSTGTTSVATAAITAATGETWWVRLQSSSTALRMRAWKDGTSEPGTWGIDTTDTTHTTAGKVGLWCYDASTAVWIAQVGVGTAGDTAPSTASNPALNVSGALTNAGQTAAGTASVKVSLSSTLTNAGQTAAASTNVIVSTSASLTNAAQTAEGTTTATVGLSGSLTNQGQTAQALSSVAVTASGALVNAGQTVSATLINGEIRIPANMTLAAVHPYTLTPSGVRPLTFAVTTTRPLTLLPSLDTAID